MHALLDDPWVRCRIEAAVGPYRGMLTSEQIDFLRTELAEVLAMDERGIRALRRARPRGDVDMSGESFVGVDDAGTNLSGTPGRAVGE